MATVASPPVVIRRDRLLFVEGKGDEIVFGAALRALGKGNDIQIVSCGGKTQIAAVYDAYTLQAEFRSVQAYGVICDADMNANGAFQSIRAMLQSHNEPAPLQPGTFISNVRRVGVFVVPNNSGPGCLETLLLATINNLAFVHLVDQYMSSLSQILPALNPGEAKVPGNFYVSSHPDKAKALAVLAGTHEPALQVGRAAEYGYWDWNSPVILPLMNFLQSI